MTGGVVLGVIVGSTIALLAVGLVLVYRSSRFVNLAHSQLGALSAVLLATLVLEHGWSWWAAFPVVVAVGVAIGLGVERVVIRRLRRQRRRAVTYLFVTIGVGQVLLALTYVPGLAPDPSTLFRERYPLPFTTVHRFGGATLTGAHVMILVLAPAAIGAIAWFLRYTVTGRSIRAAASNPDAARLCGISVDRVAALTWAIAGALSAVTAVLLAPAQNGLNAGVLGPTLLLRALGAAALGGFVSIPAAVAGGLALGLVEQVTVSTTGNGTTGELAVFIAVVGILLVRGRAISSAVGDDAGVAEDRGPIRVPPAVADRFVVRAHRPLLGAAAVVAGIVLPLLPWLDRDSNRFYLTIILVYATVGVALTMILGWAGQVSLGHFALLGIGAFLAARLGDQGRSLLVVLVVAAVVGALTMAVVGLPALRLRGLTLAVTTLGFAVVAPTWLFSRSWLGPSDGIVAHVPGLGLRGAGTLDSLLSVYYLGLGVLVAAAVSVGLLRRSSIGRCIVAARDNDRALASFGVSPATTKLTVLALSGAIAACAGVVFGAAWSDVSADLFPPALSLSILAVPVIGGLGSVAGAVAGAAVVYGPLYFVAPQLDSVLGDFGRGIGLQLALAGPALVLVPMLYPRGVAGWCAERWEAILDRLAIAVDRWRPAPDSPPVAVTGVEVRFGGVTALRDVDVHVGRGEIVGLIGTNGAGKSTLLDVVAGNRRPTAGRVAIDGVDVTDLAPEIRAGLGIGRTFQEARLFPGLTVREAVMVAVARRARVGVLASMAGAPWARATERRLRAEADELLDTTGLTAWADSLTSELSTGMRRIADLTLQLAARPRVVLLDEPTAGVAQREAEAFGPMMRDVRGRLDCSILIVEHDMPLLMGLCDRVYALEAGRVIAEGTPEEVRRDPRVVASYLGTDERAIGRSGRAAVGR